MNIRRIAATAAMMGSLSAAAIGLGAGVAPAKPGPNIPGPPNPPGPQIDGWRQPPPGQIKQFCPWQSPPGQWIGGPHGIPCT